MGALVPHVSRTHIKILCKLMLDGQIPLLTIGYMISIEGAVERSSLAVEITSVDERRLREILRKALTQNTGSLQPSEGAGEERISVKACRRNAHAPSRVFRIAVEDPISCSSHGLRAKRVGNAQPRSKEMVVNLLGISSAKAGVPPFCPGEGQRSESVTGGSVYRDGIEKRHAVILFYGWGVQIVTNSIGNGQLGCGFPRVPRVPDPDDLLGSVAPTFSIDRFGGRINLFQQKGCYRVTA